MLRRGIALLGMSLVLGSAATLALAAKRIVAENAAYKRPAGPRCVPSRLNQSDVLPGTSLAVSPLPDSLDASPTTQISLLGAPASAIAGVSASGSSTSAHSGRLKPYSQGDGASFVVAKPFRSGETVTVRGRVRGAGATHPFAFRFTVARRDAIPHPPPGRKPSGRAGDVQSLRSQPGMRAPVVSVTASSPQQSPGYVFATPYSGPGQDGPMIFDGAGNLVWFHPLAPGTVAANLQVEQYERKPVLSWWQGYIPPQGFGEGEEVIADSSYREIVRIHAGNGYRADLHDFHLSSANTAVFTVFNPIHCDLSSVGGPRDGAVTDSFLQEVDLATHLVRREWHGLDHIPLSGSYSSPRATSTQWPFDFFHLNSVDPHRDGGMLISARNTSALYVVNPGTGRVALQIGGKHGNVGLGSGVATAYQHDARELPGGELSIFDNGGVPMVHSQSRGIVVSVNPRTRTDTLVAQFEHPKPLDAGSQGNLEQLEDGDFFIGWGSEPYFSEFTSSGAMIFDAHLPHATQSYRGYRFQWTATPHQPPSVAAAAGAGGALTVYASWNGATDVASWRVLAGPSANQLAPVASAAKSGFETAIGVPGAPAYVAVQALDGSGAVLGASATIKG